MGEVERVADRAAIIREGRLVAVEEVSALKAKRARRMELHFAAPVDGRLEGIDGVRVLSVGDSGRQVELAVRGALGPLLHRLGELPIEDLSFAPADLESIFLHYYGEKGVASE